MELDKRKPINLCLPHYNGKKDIIRAFMSIVERTNYPYKLTIIDDASDKEDIGYKFLKTLQETDDLKVIFNEKNVGVTKNLNTGFALYPELDCVRLDADMEIQSVGWLKRLVDFAHNNPKVGVVAPLCVMEDFCTISSAGQWLVINGEDKRTAAASKYEIFDRRHEDRFNLYAPLEVDSVLGCCAYYKREVIDKLGGIDEEYFGWVEDNDFCIGARNEGYKVFILPDISFNHWYHAPKRESEERNDILAASEQHFIKKWGFSLYDPVPYFDEITKRYKGTEIYWRYNDGAF